MSANHHPTPARALPVAPLAALVITASVCASPAAQSYSRDADGSRLQARFHRLGTSASDSLKPPADAADWRSVKLKRGQTLSVRVSHQPHNAPVAVSLHNSQGRQLAATTSRDGIVRSSGAGVVRRIETRALGPDRTEVRVVLVSPRTGAPPRPAPP